VTWRALTERVTLALSGGFVAASIPDEVRMPEPESIASPVASTIRAIRVSDFMTRDLVTLQEGDDLALAEQTLRLGGVRHLPVVRDGKLIGLVTHRDLLRAAITHPPRGTTIGAVMTRDLTVVAPSTSLVQAARVMLAQKFGCLPVCDGTGRLVGIITESDFVRFAADMVQDLDLLAEAVASTERA
jgi:CBS domain-containing protein